VTLETKQQTRKSPGSSRFKKALIKNKTRLSRFDYKGIVHREFVLPGQTTNQKVYLRVLERPKQLVSLERSELLSSGWVLPAP
jgi:hypothetical protein